MPCFVVTLKTHFKLHRSVLSSRQAIYHVAVNCNFIFLVISILSFNDQSKSKKWKLLNWYEKRNIFFCLKFLSVLLSYLTTIVEVIYIPLKIYTNDLCYKRREWVVERIWEIERYMYSNLIYFLQCRERIEVAYDVDQHNCWVIYWEGGHVPPWSKKQQRRKREK